MNFLCDLGSRIEPIEWYQGDTVRTLVIIEDSKGFFAGLDFGASERTPDHSIE